MAFKLTYECEFCGKRIRCRTDEVPEQCECEKEFDFKCVRCDKFTCQKDRNNDIAITFCTHPDNPSEFEGNTNEKDCPLWDDEKENNENV